ncbi:MAG: FtsX-like permease family protein, partial [Thiovulaceae bacterium]|nr:FtsX-like permease family protein [Sulfurimonadaceae bacterium]
ILPKNINNISEIAARFNKVLDKVDVDTWESFVETVTDMIDIKKQSAYVMFGVLYVIIFFVLIVYSMIAILARSKEIGIMRAIGTKPVNIIKILGYETFIIAIVAVAIGGTIGGYIAWYMQTNPIPLTGDIEEMYGQFKDMGISMEPKIFAAFGWGYVFWPSLLVLLMNMFSIIYPTIKILRKKPIDEIHAI